MSDLLITAEPDVVTRLRERLDWITDQRDAAVADLHKVRLQRERWRSKAQRRSDGRRVYAQRLAQVRAEMERLERELAGERAMRRRLQQQRTTNADGGRSLDGTSAAVGRKDSSDGS